MESGQTAADTLSKPGSNAYGEVEINIKVEINDRNSKKPKDREMQKVFDIFQDEKKIQRPVGILFRKVFKVFSKFNGEFRRVQKIPGALIFAVQFTSNDDIINFRKEKSKKDLKEDLMTALADDMPGKMPFDKLELVVSFESKGSKQKMKKETEGVNLAKELKNNSETLLQVDKNLEGLINQRCTLVGENECVYVLGFQQFRKDKDASKAGTSSSEPPPKKHKTMDTSDASKAGTSSSEPPQKKHKTKDKCDASKAGTSSSEPPQKKHKTKDKCVIGPSMGAQPHPIPPTQPGTYI